MIWIGLMTLGIVLGAIGTMVGAGGGFILVPILLLLYPVERPEIITCISLAVVFLNAGSGSIAYARMKRIDYRGAIIFSLASAPGAILGAISTSVIPRRSFDAILGGLLLALAVFLMLRPVEMSSTISANGESNSVARLTRRGYFTGAMLSIVIGFLSSMLGIGGGIIHVPLMVHLLGYSVHSATATSHLTLALMALAGTVVHLATGAFSHGVRRTLSLGLGVLIGAQIGARISSRIHATWIMRGLAVCLFLVAARVLWQAYAM